MQTEGEALKAPSPLPLDERGGSDLLLLSLPAVWVHLWQYSIYSMGEGASVVSEAAAATSIGRLFCFYNFFVAGPFFVFLGIERRLDHGIACRKG